MFAGDDEQSDWVGDGGASGGFSRGVWDDSDRGDGLDDDQPFTLPLVFLCIIIFFFFWTFRQLKKNTFFTFSCSSMIFSITTYLH